MKRILAAALSIFLAASPAWAAFPTVDDSNNSKSTAESTNHIVSMPATCASGKLLLVVFITDGTESIGWPGSWVELPLQTSGINPSGAVGYLVSTGAEAGGTITVTTGTTESSSHISLCISGHLDPATQAPELSSWSAPGATVTPDPPSLTPTGGAKDYLWIAVSAQDNGAKSVSAYPTNYDSNQIIAPAGDNTTTRVALATRELNAASEDPGTFTWSGVADNPTLALTIAVHPAASAAAIFPQVIIVE